MKRRDFLKRGATGLATVGLASVAGSSSATALPEYSDRSRDQWKKMATGKTGIPTRKQLVDYDVAVLGGGLAGIAAAVAAARSGSKVVLVQDRPVLGGNSSSEMRVHVNGVAHLRREGPGAERETGIIEEMQLMNRFYNAQEAFPIWDHVLFDYVTREENLTLMLNTQAIEAVMKGDTIKSAKCWQSTTEMEYTISAKVFIDCSGDGLLAASAGAIYRTGREGKAEFNEKFAPDQPDGWTMGATLLMSSKDMGKPMPFEAPPYTLKYEADKSNPKRKIKGFENGIWWVEVGSDDDIIADFEKNSRKLMGYHYGVWDYIKNSGLFPEADNYALDWVGSLPARRESRRFMGDFILSEKDLTEYRHFDDAVAFGGWSLDEHCWAGIENLQDPPSYFHHHFKKVYEIPFRSLYSRNITNLMFAGRNVSQTHIALSSSRVMATCATMGQAVGTAADMCAKRGITPRDVSQKYIKELQEQLLRDDAYIPNRIANDTTDLAREASAFKATSTASGDVKNLVNGVSRDVDGDVNHWQSTSLPASVTLEWDKPVKLSKIEVKCDTNLQRNIFMHKFSLNNDKYTNTVPVELLKSGKLEVRVGGKWQTIQDFDKNKFRLIKFDFDQIKGDAIRFTASETYGATVAKLFEIRAYEA